MRTNELIVDSFAGRGQLQSGGTSMRYLLFDGIVHPVLPNETEAEIARRIALCNARDQAYEIWPCDRAGNKLGTVPFKIWVHRQQPKTRNEGTGRHWL